MAGGNVSPRQKMINMMYLVLTALLALNVSAEILRAFHLVEVSLEKSAINIETKNASVMKAISKYHDDFPSNPVATDVFNKAKKARDIANSTVKYLEEIKQLIVQGADGRKEDSNEDGKTEDEEITKPDDVENHANLLINQGKGKEVRDRINKTRDELFALLPKEKHAEIKSDLKTEDVKHEGATHSWESIMFEHNPAAAVVTLLTKMQGDVRNTESQILDELRKSISANDFTFDKLEAKVIPTSGTYVTSGGKYTAEIFVAASSSKQESEIKVNGSAIKTEGGIGKYEVVATGEGEKKYTALITAKKPDGTMETYKVEQSYTVVPPLAVISATKMNVVYIGLENPIAVSVPGYAADEVTPVLEPASGGTLKKDPKSKGSYILTVTGSAGKVKIVCTVKDKSTNATKKMGEQEYRVRKVPDPTPSLGTIDKSGSIASAVLRSQGSVRAPLNGFAFEGISYIPYEYKFAVLYKRGGTPYTETGKASALTPGMQAALSKVAKGDKVLIYEIKVQGPDGRRQLPSPLVFDIQ
ncbi:MAG: gliding motility protein GldM [Bacteroidetes bacterium]|nr:MAG: gliding motility protein GldM [Bacteroidota bacterium]